MMRGMNGSRLWVLLLIHIFKEIPMNEDIEKGISYKKIPDYEGYFVSEYGRVWSDKSGKYLKPKLDKDGYPVIALSKGTKNLKHKKVHRLVAESFIPRIEGREIVNHIDGGKENNHYSNLEWVTVRENVLHAFKTGLRKTPCGLDSKKSRLNAEHLKEIYEFRLKGLNKRQIAKLVGVPYPTVQLVFLGRRYRKDFQKYLDVLVARGLEVQRKYDGDRLINESK